MALRFSFKKTVPTASIASNGAANNGMNLGVKRPREVDVLPSTAEGTDGARLPNGEVDELARRQEKLAAWKAKQSAASASLPSVAPVARAAVDDKEEGEIAPTPAPSAVPAVSGAPIAIKAVTLRAQPVSAVAKPKNAFISADDDETSAGSGAGAGLQARKRPALTLLDDEDDGKSAAPEDGSSAAAAADDDIDGYLLQFGAPAVQVGDERQGSSNAAPHQPPSVITADELFSALGGQASADDSSKHDLGTIRPNGIEGATGSPGAGDDVPMDGSSAVPTPITGDGGVGNDTNEDEEDTAEEQEYRRAFLESFRGASSSAASAPSSSPTASDSAGGLARSAAAAGSDASLAADGGAPLESTGVGASSSSGANKDTRDDAASVASSSVVSTRAAAAAAAAATDEEEARFGAELAALAASTGDEDAALFAGEEWEGKRVSALEAYQAKLRAKMIPDVDHSKVEYEPFRKAFYIEHRDVASLAPEAVVELRDDLEIKVRGKNVSRPISTWEQAGLPDKFLGLLEGRGFGAPFAIQRQALPVIMSGRDVIGVAKTGSGKTLAYLLPLFRQLLDQRPLSPGEGPRALVFAPSRELVTQIYSEARKFAKALDMRVTAVYGGSSIAEQIAELKRGSDVVVCTPGRMIELLSMRDGRLVSLSRVTYVVLDEADRMFDMGFEPQIAKIVHNVRPDRQTVMFSATFPQHVEALARKALKAPVEIVVGGRSMASSDIAQFVEIHEEGDPKFLRTLQLLGEWTEMGQVIIFVDTKEHVDFLFADLLKAGYGALSLHGGKEQVDRDQTLSDFKSGAQRILIATSVAGRGLDVKDCVLVINYSAPNHLEEYVHRVGRTGRAGRKGTAYTFLTPQEGQYAGDLIRALKDAKQEVNVNPALRALADEFARRVAAGEAKKHRSGYAGTKGFKFDGSELTAGQALREAQRRSYELEAGIKTIEDVLEEESAKRDEAESRRRNDGGDEDADAEDEDGGMQPPASSRTDAGASSSTSSAPPEGSGAAASAPPAPLRVPADPARLAVLRAKVMTTKLAMRGGKATEEDVAKAEADLKEAETIGVLATPSPAAAAAAAAGAATSGAARAAADAAAAVAKQLGLSVGSAASSSAGAAAAGAPGGPGASTGPSEEIEINEYPEKARKKLFREGIPLVRESYPGVTVVTRGVHVEPGRRPPPGERKLYVLITGHSESAVRAVRKALVRTLEEETLRAGMSLDRSAYGKFTV